MMCVAHRPDVSVRRRQRPQAGCFRWLVGVGIGVLLAGSVAAPLPAQGALAAPRQLTIPSWVSWTARSEPLFEGEFGVASDPSIVVVDGVYRMYYTGLDPDTGRTIVCLATSTDGVAWTNAATGSTRQGEILRGVAGTWMESVESSFVIRFNNEYLLYFSGYRDVGAPAKGFPASLGLARSADGVRFSLASPQPVLQPTSGWFDNDAIYSPTIASDGGQLVMVYSAHCYTDCSRGGAPGVALVAATSVDGVSWTKRENPVLTGKPEISWMRDGAAESHLLKAPDGMWYLFFTGVADEERAIGIARGTTPFGPWDLNTTPALPTAPGGGAQTLAPFVLVEGNRVRMWHLSHDRVSRYAIGYAEATWPLRLAPP